MKSLRLSSSIKDLKSFNLWQSLVAEFIGTFILVFIGFGSAYNNMNPVKLGLGFGLAGLVAIYSIGPISGGHINPAVSFGLLVARQISLVRFLLYSAIQILSATTAFWVIMTLTDGNVLNKSILKVTFNKTLPSASWENARIVEEIHRVESPLSKVLCEMIITAVLVFTVMRLCVEKSRSPAEKSLAPLVIGISITIGVYCGMNISGGSMNPAASLGKYFLKRSSGVWTHIVGPLLGGTISALLQQLIFTSKLSKKHIISYFLSSDFEYDEDENSHDGSKGQELTDKC